MQALTPLKLGQFKAFEFLFHLIAMTYQLVRGIRCCSGGPSRKGLDLSILEEL